MDGEGIKGGEKGEYPDDDVIDGVRSSEAAASAVGTKAEAGIESAWRYAGRPLLRIGAKGATESHGNSLRELLEAHTVVRVKINTYAFEGGTFEDAFCVLRDLAKGAGASPGIELLRIRSSENTILIGQPGTLDRIRSGDFPPPPPPPRPGQSERKSK